ncbi:hypothetical protein FEZ18_08220 [Oceanihabitans sp. IOP_32]|uniref:hypothetical protein n=1 Tax=Oceanihabitans sp. IOP_32 TaxID=2529032 RepID=UPI001293775A|nr:hypothetical protein [Oceanihabitans sp. IOP_32]QFZ54784.1 hypothetical protein FEZ18_08220 [Oceanihabitans sp. IOP_32]
MRKLLYISVFALLLFSCKGNGQSTNAVAKHDNVKGVVSDSDNQEVFSGDYNDLLTLELASRITGFEPSKARKTHALKRMTGEILRYNWENGREEIKEKSASNRKRKTYPRSDLVQIKWVDTEADLASFLEFIEPEEHPELLKITDVGDRAYWNSKKSYLQVYYNGVSFTLQVDISNDEVSDKEKTIALAKLIIAERIK